VAGSQPGQHVTTGVILMDWRDGVLQVKHDRIRPARDGLAEAVWAVRWDEQSVRAVAKLSAVSMTKLPYTVGLVSGEDYGATPPQDRGPCALRTFLGGDVDSQPGQATARGQGLAGLYGDRADQ
jgi:hypothetical protein